MLRGVKTTGAAGDASRAREEGRTVFLYKFNIPGSTGIFSGPVPDAAEVIEAVENTGWSLAQMTFAETSRKNHGAMLLLFRRR